jgi:hypothetical protein
LSNRAGGGFRNSGGSRGTFFLPRIAVQLAEQGIAVTRGLTGEMGDEHLNLLPRGFAQSFRSAEVDGIRLHQLGIELVLANNLTESIANPSAVSI